MTTRIRLIVAVLLALSLASIRPAQLTFAAMGTQVADCSFATLQTDLQAGGDYYYAPGQCPNPIQFTDTINLRQNASLTAQGDDVTLDGGNRVRLFLVSAGFGLTGLVLSQGSDGYEGAAVDNYGTLTVTDSTLSSNVSTYGGAIFNRGTLTITHSTFFLNNAPSGGAIFNQATTNITDSTFVSNTAHCGGAFYNQLGTLTVRNSTLWNNLGLGAGALCNLARAIFSGTIVAEFDPRNPQCYLTNYPGASFTDDGYNLESGTDCHFTGTGSLQNTNPQLDPAQGPQNNGGPTGTVALPLGSPAIDVIPTSSGLCPSTDQRGYARPDESETSCDIGAYESAYQITTLSSVSGTGTYGGTAALTATLTSGTTPVSGKTITFRINGNAVCGGNSQPTCPTTDTNGVATLQNVALSGIKAGSYPTAIGASFAGDNGASASTGTGALTVSMATQTITFGSLANHTYGDSPFQVSATASSGLPVSFSVGSTDQCTITGSTVTIIGAGSCTVTASQTGNSNYNPAASVSQTFSIAKAPATISLVQSSLSATYDGNSHTATATTSPSGLTYSVSYTDSANNPVTNPTNAGSYSLTASITDPNYQGSTSGTLVIAKASQSITFGSLTDRTYGDSPFTVSATGGGSGNPVRFTASPSTVCTAGGTNGGTITLVGAGTCTVTASQAGNQNYLGALPVAQSFTVAPLKLALTVSPATATTGQTATASFTIGNHTSTAKTVSGTMTLTYTGSSGPFSISVPFKLTLAAGQTLSQKVSFTIQSSWPRGTYTVTVKATDSDGTVTGSVPLTVT